MGLNKKLFSICLSVFCFFTFLNTQNVLANQPNDNEIAQLRKLFLETVGQDFEIIKDYVNQRSVARGGETYWLAHLKPKKSGHYAIKYSFKFTHKFEYPEEGENELFIRVGEKNCYRNLADNYGMANICLGDTIIAPIRLDNRAEHTFSIKSTYSDGKSIGTAPQNARYFANDMLSEEVENPLADNLKYLGTTRSVMPHRSAGGETIVLTAYFEVKKTGRFNLGITQSSDDENVNQNIKLNALNALPIIVVESGTPITGLVFRENTINYGDKKRFSGHAGNNFLTKLLILQPGDVFSVQYATWTNRWSFGEDKSKIDLNNNKNLKPLIQKLPFMVNKDWSYNEWLIDYLPVN